ncbi:MAG: hypothetical protein JST80_00900 [Bdellovibrionales bacterium]|nr:hypothetical protein [Bdellovibrionales bacterium]
MNRLIPSLLLSCLVTFIGLSAQARGGSGSGPGREENAMVSNGQGVSSPSFWDGLSGENPAGLTQNQSLKLQGGLASLNSSMSNLKPSGGLLIGNGLLGAGIEYTTYGGGAAINEINWGIGGYLTSISTAFGISGHHVSGSSSGSYDLGVLIDLGSNLRLGGMIPNFTNGLDIVGAGLTYKYSSDIDFVVDGAYSLNHSYGTIKPGLTIHTGTLNLTGAYGIHLTGSTNALLYEDFAAGLGFVLTRTVLIEYEYRGLPQHRIGLTLKLD